MQVRPLGATGMLTPPLAFGVSGPLGAPITTSALVARLTHQALEGGVRLFDTAPFYGAAEARLGAALRGRPEALIVTKCGKRRAGGILQPAFAAADIAASIEASRQALGRDRLDALLLHGPDPADLTPALMDALRAHQDAGRIGWFGVAGRGTELAAAATGGFAAIVQAPLTIGLPVAAATGAGFMAIEVLSAARLSPASAGGLWRAAKRIRGLAAPGGDGDPRTILSAAAAEPGVSCIVSTTTRADHLAANLAALADL